jgi:hypothetical protein
VLRLQGLGLCDLKPDRYVASDQIESYLEPDGRSGITSPLGSDLSVDRCASYELDGDARHNKVFIQVWPP